MTVEIEHVFYAEDAISAAAVFVMQVFRWRGAWVFVALYWAVLTVKNFMDWRKTK